MVIFLVSIISLGLFMLGLSITLIYRGHHIQGDVGDNDAMRSLGLRCSLEQMGGAGCGGDGCGGQGDPTNPADLECSSCQSRCIDPPEAQ